MDIRSKNATGLHSEGSGVGLRLEQAVGVILDVLPSCDERESLFGPPRETRPEQTRKFCISWSEEPILGIGRGHFAYFQHGFFRP